MTKLKVGILYGGRSVEHGVSINSARNIESYIDKHLYETLCIGISTKGVWYLTPSVSKEIEKGSKLKLHLDAENPRFEDEKGNLFSLDVAFPVLHGTDGEDGSIQGLLKAMSIPMVGTGVLGSSVSMSKLVAKQLMQQAGIPVTDFLFFRHDQRDAIHFDEVKKKLGLPFMVKAANLGSSVGVSKVKSKEDFDLALQDSFKYDDCVLLEEYVKGREIECAILGNQPPEASLPGEIIISSNYEFYTFDAKYVDGEAVKIEVPAQLDNAISDTIRSVSIKAYQQLQCEDFSRVDLFLSESGKVYVNEINTIPGFTNSSMYPMMWKERGVSFTELISRLITLGLERYKNSQRTEKEFQSSLKF
ncbi:MAG TPA: D-alanine--D-alanine ligase A [Cytophagales bacterium]|nr:D-alanine--D-alanine ligase A [Cytophagales bacterium]